MSEPVDHFATLGLGRSAAIDEAVVRERFHELSRELHPDTAGGDESAFAAVNEAQRVLRSPSARLRHLLELEFGSPPESAASMSEVLLDLFGKVGAALAEADGVISKRRAATSAVAKALLAAEEMAAQQALLGTGGKLMARRQEVEAGLGEIALSDRRALVVAWHELSFLEKWNRQVQERIGALL
jgi:curved DNA-binding protein CbpA